MTTTRRIILACTHLAVIGVGVTLGLSGFPKPASPPTVVTEITPRATGATSFPLPAPPRISSGPTLSSADCAANWDSLKGSFLPKNDRLLLEKEILEKWSVLDLTAAVRAVFGETTDDGPIDPENFENLSLLDCCAPGIMADPLKAWELVRTNSFGLETGRFRKAWLECVIKSDVSLVFPILDELPKTEHLSALRLIADAACENDDPAKRELIWTHFSNLPDTPDGQDVLTQIGETISSYSPLEHVVPRLLEQPTPAERRICIRALSLALFIVIEREKIPGLFQSLPAAERGEVAAAGMRHADRDGELAITLAKVALDSGNLDALQTAGSDPDFTGIVMSMKQTGTIGDDSRLNELADWAFRLPDDPRTVEIFHKTISGIICPANCDAIREKLEALPAGLRKEQGMAVVAMEEERQRAEEAEEAGDEQEEE